MEPYGACRKWGIAFGQPEPATITATKLFNLLKFKKIHLNQSPLEIFSKLNNHYKTAYLLESIEGPRKLAQYSFIGFDPQTIINIKDGIAQTRNERTDEVHEEHITDPLTPIENVLRNSPTANKEFRFAGGAVGFISYDAVRNWEKLPSTTTDDLRFPDAEMGVFDDGIVFDHKQKRVYYYYYDRNRLSEIESYLKKPMDSECLSFGHPETNITKERYEKAVEKAKDYVNHGDIFQVVLSKRYDFRFEGSLTQFYGALRVINPSPYMYFIKFGARQIVGSSPEMLVRVDNRTVETYPIAGTRPVSTSAAENKRLAKDLLADPKECAEHVMLVDLARNDVGRVSKFGSVRVPEFMRVQRYSHVQHIVSRVVGDLRDDCESYDALRAVFPAGTVSGAPKIRAMEIIEEQEPVRRGPYAGAVGYFSFNGNADFAITIRTLFADGDAAHIQVGAGIVADSVPEREWYETEHKAGALLKAIEVCGGISR